MVLIVDSGSTKTHWHFLSNEVNDIVTEGINPYYLNSKEIAKIINDQFYSIDIIVTEILFFGAGCNSPEKEKIVRDGILLVWPSARVVVKSDLLAACYATSGKQKGLVCILGTGANSCEYDGIKVLQNTPPLGFILGDEGSGAYLGMQLINGIYKQKLGEDLRKSFESEFNCDISTILNRVYKEPWANRFLASLSPFVKQNIEVPKVRLIVEKAFALFIENNLIQYNGVRKLPIHFVGSVAYHFQDILRTVIESHGLIMGRVMQAPMEGLKEYYTSEYSA